MKRFYALCALTAIAACARAPIESSPDDEARLGAELRQYSPAGAPVACVSTRQLRGNRSVGRAIIFDGLSSRIWVNRPAGACDRLGQGRALVTRTPSTQLCRGDIARVVDPITGMEFGGCSLGEFEPYRRTDTTG